jgi:hypothetical protein
MFVPKKDRIRHNILIALNTKTNGQAYHVENISGAWLMSIPELLNKANISDKEYRLVHSLMYDRKEIIITTKDNAEYIQIAQKGMTALNEKSYISDGIKKVNDSIYDTAKWMLPILLVFISLYTMVKNRQLTEDIQRTKQEIQQIQKGLDTLSKSKNIAPQTKIYPDSSKK